MHSHPKITILPSNVDLTTQLNFQNLEPLFFGLIYGCFHENQNQSMRLQLLAFQSLASLEKINVPLHLETAPDYTPRLLDVAELYVIEELMENDESQPSFQQLNPDAPSQTFSRMSHIETPLQIAASALRLSKIQQSLVRPIIQYLRDGCC